MPRRYTVRATVSGMNADEQTAVQAWDRLMINYPSDGWDGAADAIARHDARVRTVEADLDTSNPGWHERYREAGGAYQRRSAPTFVDEPAHETGDPGPETLPEHLFHEREVDA